jgi:hypothetical protein
MKEYVPSFAFAPPPISPGKGSQTAAPRAGINSHDFATSTPPRQVKPDSSIHYQEVDKVQVSQNCASGCIESSLFDTSISPIIFSGGEGALNRPNTPYSYFTASPPDTASTLGLTISAERHPIVPSRNIAKDAANEDQTQQIASFTPPAVDPFGATWAVLQSSKSENALPIVRPFDRRRFFFASSYLNKLNTPPAYLLNNPKPFNSASSPQSFSDSSTSHIFQHTWSPSFPEAKLPNHRHARPLPKSQLRNNFLGAENPLITEAAIEAATSAANQNTACLGASDALYAANTSTRVRFRTPTRSPPLSFSDSGGSGLPECFEEAQPSQLNYPSDCAGDEHTLTDEMCFCEEPPWSNIWSLRRIRAEARLGLPSVYLLTAQVPCDCKRSCD